VIWFAESFARLSSSFALGSGLAKAVARRGRNSLRFLCGFSAVDVSEQMMRLWNDGLGTIDDGTKLSVVAPSPLEHHSE